MLAPAQYGLTLGKNEKVRLSIVTLTGDGDFRMEYEAGHSVGRKTNFRLSKLSMAGHALETGEIQWTENVDEDPRWTPHPLAKPGSAYKSLACVPLSVSGEVVAVLNVASSEEAAFCYGDLVFIELLGTFLSLAWALAVDASDSDKVLEQPSLGDFSEDEESG